jgi:hypothetical protein
VSHYFGICIEMDPAVLRQLNQDATKRQRTNPPVGTTQQVDQLNIPAVGPSPSPSGLTTVGSASSTIQPVSSAREETSESILLTSCSFEKMLYWRIRFGTKWHFLTNAAF